MNLREQCVNPFLTSSGEQGLKLGARSREFGATQRAHNRNRARKTEPSNAQRPTSKSSSVPGHASVQSAIRTPPSAIKRSQPLGSGILAPSRSRRRKRGDPPSARAGLAA
jgi:hypothetical protein